MPETFFQGFEREDQSGDDCVTTEVLVEFTMSPIIPAVLYGNYPSPAEGGEVEIVKVHTDAEGWGAKWSDEEDETWCRWIEQNVRPEGLGDYPDYYDD